MSLVPVGRLVGIFGIRGELKFRSLVGAAEPRAGKEYALGSDEGARRVRCSSVRRHHARTVVALEGVTTPEAARAYVGRELYAEREAVPLAPNEYLDTDLIGCRLLDAGGNALGDVVGVEHLPAQDCLVVVPVTLSGAREASVVEGRALVPLVRAFVREVDILARTIVVELPEGLL